MGRRCHSHRSIDIPGQRRPRRNAAAVQCRGVPGSRVQQAAGPCTPQVYQLPGRAARTSLRTPRSSTGRFSARRAAIRATRTRATSTRSSMAMAPIQRSTSTTTSDRSTPARTTRCSTSSSITQSATCSRCRWSTMTARWSAGDTSGSSRPRAVAKSHHRLLRLAGQRRGARRQRRPQERLAVTGALLGPPDELAQSNSCTTAPGNARGRCTFSECRCRTTARSRRRPRRPRRERCGNAHQALDGLADHSVDTRRQGTRSGPTHP